MDDKDESTALAEIRSLAEAYRLSSMCDPGGREIIHPDGSSVHVCDMDAREDLPKIKWWLIGKGWQPIETAPKDGTPILVCAGEDGFKTSRGRVGVAQWGEVGRVGDPQEWVARDCCDQVTTYRPSHWMPRPDPPEGS